MVNVTIYETGPGTDSLTGKEGTDGLRVNFGDDSGQLFLSWKSFRQLLNLKMQGQSNGSAKRGLDEQLAASTVPVAEEISAD